MDYTQLKASDYKPAKCPICRKKSFRGPRAMSMHVHLEHNNLSPKEMQRYIAIGTFGSSNVSQWVNILDKERNPDEHPEIPSAVKKYWKMLRHEETIASKKEKEKEQKKEIAKKEKEPEQKIEEPKPLTVLKVGAIKTKLSDMPEDAIIVVWIKDLNSWRFIKDAFRRNPDNITGDKDNHRDIDLKLTKTIDIEKKDNQTILDPNNKVLHVNELLKFLRWDKISDDEIIYINSKGEGGAKLTKIEKRRNIFGSEGVLFIFEYDKRYYRGFVRDYLKQRKEKKI